MNKLFHYFVEGECEQKFINVYKNPKYSHILAGKVEVCNFINKEISDLRIMKLKKGTNIILVYDTDIENDTILKKNIRKLNKYGFNKIYHIHSVKTFEDELIYSSNLTNIRQLFNTQSCDEFKSRFCHANDESLVKKLSSVNFKADKMWSRQGANCFSKYNTKEGIKLIKI